MLVKKKRQLNFLDRIRQQAFFYHGSILQRAMDMTRNHRTPIGKYLTVLESLREAENSTI